MSTIKDVANKARVSVATVSRVLNDKGYVSLDKKRRVQQAIKVLNYKPNEIARSLFNKKTDTVALIVPDITNPFFPELAKAIEETLNTFGYTLMLCNANESPEKEQEYLNVFKSKHVDGVILASDTLSIENIKRFKLPLVVIDRSVRKNVSSVFSDNVDGARQATRFLLKTGCKVVAHIRGPKHVITANERYKGYVEVVKPKCWFHEDLVVMGNYDMKTAVSATISLLNKFPEIDGIFAGNDIMGVGVIKALHQMGKRIPEDISVIGFDGIGLSEMIYPELTTIAQPIYKMGSIGARMLIEKIERETEKETWNKLPVQLVKRSTTNT